MRNQIPEDTTTTLANTGRPGAAAPRTGSTERRSLVVAAAAVAAMLTWLVADPVLSIDLKVLEAPGGTTTRLVSAGSIVSSAIIAGLLSWALLAVLERKATQGVTVWRWVTAAVALVSLLAPLSLAQNTGATVVLTLLHVAVASVLILALPGTRRAGATR
ncbi:DUF6069 family protein [Ornithinimicrobium cryptoxanthini]|uniref:DUF6069 family protein n=1 Tax=Ornithinimicrobium cryptoxanthini TaxID=2934161 RepID=A0ABY4YL53_9MICO|nr:DUF6069 family protein [Ornithinimicrobium cryptoxanthini]USQ76872.1 DUF6069 family protein [Ornithinimicrobium cryptoxanthini]